LIVEGLFILHFKQIAELLNLKIFIEADEEVALQRRIKRDGMERGYPEEDVLYKWKNHVVPAYREFLLPYKEECDQIVFNNDDTPDDIIRITEEITQELKTKLSL
ncbi:MAG: uridine kinase, partial [Sphingobacteriaceae bacterium]|nr:uridine kinase [Sphingobacteriaceae bacterium]